MPEIALPHPDAELGIARAPIPYRADVPANGLTARTGLIFYVHGYGEDFDSPYSRKLRRYLADRYDCVVVTVDYFGADCYRSGVVKPGPNFFVNINTHFEMSLTIPEGMDPIIPMNLALDELCRRGVTSLPNDVVLIREGAQYNSFGLLPALDHLQVLHRCLQDYPIDRSRLFLLGTSYGGYIGLLLNKLAPNTFRLIIDNAGFSSPEDDYISVYGCLGGSYRGVSVSAFNAKRFSQDPKALNFFSPGCAAIRELRNKAHYATSQTLAVSYHSATDTVASLERKQDLHRLLAAIQPSSLTVVGEADLDGRLFKTLDHGMLASMRGLFERSYEYWEGLALPAVADTDFDLESELLFDCVESYYSVRFSWEEGVQLVIIPKRG